MPTSEGEARSKSFRTSRAARSDIYDRTEQTVKNWNTFAWDLDGENGHRVAPWSYRNHVVGVGVEIALSRSCGREKDPFGMQLGSEGGLEANSYWHHSSIMQLGDAELAIAEPPGPRSQCDWSLMRDEWEVGDSKELASLGSRSSSMRDKFSLIGIFIIPMNCAHSPSSR